MTDKEKLKKIRAVYELAQKNKGEDRLTQADIKQAKKVLNYKEPKKAADYGAIKDYAELSKGGGMDMGKKLSGMDMGKKLKGVKSFDDLIEYHKKETAADKRDENKVSKTMGKDTKLYKPLNKGGGMDIGKMPNTVKPEPRGNPGIVENVVGKGGDYIKDLID